MSRVPEKAWKVVKVSWVAVIMVDHQSLCLSHHSPRFSVLTRHTLTGKYVGVHCLGFLF